MIEYKDVQYPSRNIYIKGYGRRDISTHELEEILIEDMESEDSDTRKMAAAIDVCIFFYVREYELEYTKEDLEKLILMNI